MRRREEPMEGQNKINEEKDNNIQRQETEEVVGREKIGEGAIKKMGKQGEIATKPKPVEVRDTQEKKWTKKND